MDTRQKTLTLIREDVEKAIELYDVKTPPLGFAQVAMICPIFQALKRDGLEPVVCGTAVASLFSGASVELDESAQRITWLPGVRWKDLLKEEFPITFTITKLHN